MASVDRINSIRELMVEILEIQKEDSKDDKTVKRVQEIIKESNELVEDSDFVNEIILDAKILHTGSQVVNSNVASFDPNLLSFNEEEYKKGILSYLNENSHLAPAGKIWKCFAPFTYSIFHKSDSPNFMLGSVSLEPLPEKEKARSERNKKIAESKTQLLEASECSRDDNELIEENIYEHILKSLFKCYKENDRKPINFIEFIIDPDSYWASIQNIFYFSFLVRDGRVNMILKKNLPLVEPIIKDNRPPENSNVKSNQFSFALDMELWRECIQNFKITSPKIKPFFTN